MEVALTPSSARALQWSEKKTLKLRFGANTSDLNFIEIKEGMGDNFSACEVACGGKDLQQEPLHEVGKNLGGSRAIMVYIQ